ncbi:hypothetical protein B0H13DRAFT_2365207 [Mycena leptocephala]|nr:hypothetical protein B0H13DRAFT_2365207 [Mycena leptocephala]
MLKLASLYDIPSSPLGSPQRGPTGGSSTPAGSPPGSGRAQGTPSPSRGRRSTAASPYAAANAQRRALRDRSWFYEDLTQFGALNARKCKLKPEGVIQLEVFAKDADTKSEVATFALLLQIAENQALILPAATGVVIPKKFENKINIHSIRTLLDPTLSAYVKKSGADSPSGIMKALVQDHCPNWGLFLDQIQDKAVWDPVSSRIRHRLTDTRYDIKKTRLYLDPLDIITLCEALVQLVPDAGLKVTLPMLGRIAMLRHILIDLNGGPKFWEKVDEQLAELRGRYADVEDSEVKISKVIAKVLKNDCRNYGNPDLSVFT